MRVPDSQENRATFGGQNAGGGRGESGYPMVRVVAAMALRSHVLAAFRFADYRTGETTLAQGLYFGHQPAREHGVKALGNAFMQPGPVLGFKADQGSSPREICVLRYGIDSSFSVNRCLALLAMEC